MPDDLLSRMDAFLEGRPAVTPAAELPEDAVEGCAMLRKRLSGGFGEAVRVEPGDGDEAGAYFAAVPVRLLAASGLRIVESAVPMRDALGERRGVTRALAATAPMVQNAENRVTRFLPEGWRAALDSLPTEGDEVWFRLREG